MEIRSVDRSAFLCLEHEFMAPSHFGEPPQIRLIVKQSAYGFTGKTSPVWMSQENIMLFIEAVQRLEQGERAILNGREDHKNHLLLEIQITDEGKIILESTLTKWYSCTEEIDCKLQSQVLFKINERTLRQVVTELQKMSQVE